jgi:bile acid transporter
METASVLIRPLDQLLLAVMIFVIMFGMGASLCKEDFNAALKRPRALLIGFLSQFGLMPFLAFTLAVFLQLKPPLAIALVLIGCLPGGTTSNMFAYFSRGSVALSVTMTTTSTIFSLLLMPLLLAFYAPRIFLYHSTHALQESAEFIIPHGNIVVSLVLVLVPVGLGMLLRRISLPWAKTAEDTAGFAGIIVILFLLASAGLRNGQRFIETPLSLYAASIGIGLSGFIFGWVMAFLSRLEPRYRRTISLETGIQNGPIAFAVILLSFRDNIRDEMLWVAILYSTFIVATASIITLLYRKYGRFDWELHRNRVIHSRLFGPDYSAPYPPLSDAGGPQSLPSAQKYPLD